MHAFQVCHLDRRIQNTQSSHAGKTDACICAFGLVEQLQRLEHVLQQHHARGPGAQPGRKHLRRRKLCRRRVPLETHRTQLIQRGLNMLACYEMRGCGTAHPWQSALAVHWVMTDSRDAQSSDLWGLDIALGPPDVDVATAQLHLVQCHAARRQLLRAHLHKAKAPCTDPR